MKIIDPPENLPEILDSQPWETLDIGSEAEQSTVQHGEEALLTLGSSGLSSLCTLKLHISHKVGLAGRGTFDPKSGLLLGGLDLHV